MSKIIGELDASIQAKLEADTDFQSSLEGLSDDEKAQKVEERKTEELDKELKAIKETAEKAKKAEELANNYKVRAEKAEKDLKASKTGSAEEPKKDGTTGLSQKDIIAIARAEVHEDDIDEVLNYAEFKKITVAEALKDKVMVSVLKDKAEERRSAEATNTGATRGGTKVTGEAVLNDMRHGKFSEDEEDIKKGVKAFLFKK